MVLILDNYDSFTYNLVHLLEQFTDDFAVFRNDAITLDAVEEYDKILISPGPGLPEDSGIMMELIKRYAERKSILGVCLGMQGIVLHFGGSIRNMETVKHGVSTAVKVIDENETLFKGMPHSFEGGLYYSWEVERSTFPENMLITAEDEEGGIMAVSHKQYDVKGVQFHPESIMSEHGKQLIGNWVLERKN